MEFFYGNYYRIYLILDNNIYIYKKKLDNNIYIYKNIR